MPNRIACLRRRMLAGFVCCMLMTLAVGATGAATEPKDRKWGVGWDDGLTLRRWLGEWELALSAGPRDYLRKTESQFWDTNLPDENQGITQVPDDDRTEEGWVRLQAGHRVASYDNLALVAFSGLTYNWADSQHGSIQVDYNGLYDTYEADRFTNRWTLEFGLRPAWRPVPFVSIEMAFGLRFRWDDWTATEMHSYDNGDRVSRQVQTGDYRSFEHFGWSGLSSLKFLFWF